MATYGARGATMLLGFGLPAGCLLAHITAACLSFPSSSGLGKEC